MTVYYPQEPLSMEQSNPFEDIASSLHEAGHELHDRSEALEAEVKVSTDPTYAERSYQLTQALDLRATILLSTSSLVEALGRLHNQLRELGSLEHAIYGIRDAVRDR